jgi:hypothetical protein
MKLAMKQSRSIGSLVAGYRLFSILLPSVFVLYFFIWSAKIFFNPPKPAMDRQGLRIIVAIEMPKTIFENYPYKTHGKTGYLVILNEGRGLNSLKN